MKTYLLLSYILIILSFLGCRKSRTHPNTDNGLPPATQTGANTFGCRLNGQPFIAYRDYKHIGGGIRSDTLLIGGSPKTLNYFESILLETKGKIHRPATYSLSDTDVKITLITDSTCLGIMSNILTQNAIAGTLQITKFDTVQKIVSGLFNCVMPIPNCDTLTVTDGRFDIRYE